MNTEKTTEAFRLLKTVPHRIGTDGSGITTLVALQGCPLDCRYCINHEILKNGRTRTVTPEELLSGLMENLCYFYATGGGVTFGGGEPLLQYKAILEFAKITPEWLPVNLETSLNVPSEAVTALIPFVSEWIVDIKTLDDGIYAEYTGKDRSNTDICLGILAERVPEKCLIRIPVIPGYKDRRKAEEERELLAAEGFMKFDLFDYVTESPAL